jgi:hypothetical protein
MFSTPLLSRTRRFILLTYDLMDRTILIVGFVAFCTGLVTFWGIFVSADAPGTTLKQEENLIVASYRRKDMPFLMALPIGSKGAFSSGSASSISVAGVGALLKRAGYARSNTTYLYAL